MKYKTDVTKHVLQVGADANRLEDCSRNPLYSATNWNSIEVIWLSLENTLEQ